ncbi:MAG: DapH/DapD/GlmU-related protein [Clostridium sp.]
MVEEDCFIGVGTKVIQGIDINEESKISAGITVLEDVK